MGLVTRKSVEELVTLREAGLGIIYHGLESGDDEVLELIDKGGTRAEAIETAQKLGAAEITHSVIVLFGDWGRQIAMRSKIGTAKTVTARRG